MDARTKRLVDEFMSLVQVNSATRDERAIADVLHQKLENLGFAVSEDNAGESIGGSAGNLIARLEGDLPGPTLLLSAHMDRVPPGQNIKPEVRDGIIYSDGSTILAADDLAGVVCILEAVRRVKEDNLAHLALEVVFTVAEEGGLNGAKAFNTADLTAEFGYFFDSAGQVGTIIIQAPSQHSLEFVVKGRAAHAGVSPEKGISALQLAAQGIAAMQLGRIDAETTANIGVFQSGSATNIVPDLAVLKGEARSLSMEKLEAQSKGMVDALEQAVSAGGGSLETKLELSYPNYSFASDADVVQRVKTAVEAVGLEPILKATGGGSDANIFNGRGLPSVVLGMGYNNVHSTQENQPIDELERITQVAAALICPALA